ncbi:alpha/beta hydrolase [Pseudonocardia halophobica]|uniref:Acetylhydrolase n=1 Tax=Pseudonocardia halophobica TaxID=29401 RepID=A0A9W6NZ94_9PSEU|nr:alpha/beta hydrolase [Pseudonocardia halophobica]GLL14427.1 acetylhydrolase [Pseudonocardia halophobica]
MLDHEAAALLAAITEQNLPPLAEGSVADARLRVPDPSFAQGPPLPLAAVVDRAIPGPAGELPVRIYTPEGDGPFPLVVYFHGGGFVIGSIATADQGCRLIAREAGAVVISVGYRLAPEHPYPAAPEDCYAAVKWVAAHAPELAGDPQRLVVAGDSAGANLAAVVSIMARDRGGPEIAHQVLLYPNVDLTNNEYPSKDVENAKGYMLEKEDIDWFYSHYLTDPARAGEAYASPLLATSHAGLPAATVITAGFDPLRDEGAAYVDALQGSGVPAEHLSYPSLIHGFYWFPALITEAHGVAAEIGRRLRSALSN